MHWIVLVVVLALVIATVLVRRRRHQLRFPEVDQRPVRPVGLTDSGRHGLLARDDELLIMPTGVRRDEED